MALERRRPKRIADECQILRSVSDPRRVSPSFASLCTAMDAAGVEVHILLGESGRHVIRLVGATRSLSVPVTRGFDVDVMVMCCSLALCPESPRSREWPELVALAMQDVGVSDRDRPGRPS